MMEYQPEQRISLCEALDRILNKGAVVAAELTISVADIDLIYISLQALVTSVERARQLRAEETEHDPDNPPPWAPS